MKEDKQKICDLLIPVFRETKDLYNIVSIHYDEKQELVYVNYALGLHKVIDVAEDSGIAMIKDILDRIA